MWTTDNILQLIEELRINECLWDAKNVHYRSREKRGGALKSLSEKFGVSIMEIEKKIHTLKSQFRREHRHILERVKSGASPKRCSWFGYEPLLFLLSAKESRRCRSTEEYKELNVEANDTDMQASPSQTQDEETTPCETESTEASLRISAVRPKTRRADDSSTTETQDWMKSLTQAVTHRDSFTIFGDFVADSLRTSRRPYTEITIAKKYISDIVFNLQMGAYRGNERKHFNLPTQNAASFCEPTMEIPSHNSRDFNSPSHSDESDSCHEQHL